jgi:hypothetical protein
LPRGLGQNRATGAVEFSGKPTPVIRSRQPASGIAANAWGRLRKALPQADALAVSRWFAGGPPPLSLTPNSCQVVELTVDPEGRLLRIELWLRSWSPGGGAAGAPNKQLPA